MITLNLSDGRSVTINPDQVNYVAAGENDTTVVYFSTQVLYIKQPYLEVIGQLKAQGGGCCR